MGVEAMEMQEEPTRLRYGISKEALRAWLIYQARTFNVANAALIVTILIVSNSIQNTMQSQQQSLSYVQGQQETLGSLFSSSINLTAVIAGESTKISQQTAELQALNSVLQDQLAALQANVTFIVALFNATAANAAACQSTLDQQTALAARLNANLTAFSATTNDLLKWRAPTIRCSRRRSPTRSPPSTLTLPCSLWRFLRLWISSASTSRRLPRACSRPSWTCCRRAYRPTSRLCSSK